MSASPRRHGVGAPTTWVLSNHDVTRHATRYGRLDFTGGGVEAEDRVRPDTPVDLALGRPPGPGGERC